jgi:hypothetical protein
MADNTQLNENSTPGDIIATDDIGGVKHQRVKVQYGPDGSATDVTETTPLPVTVTNQDDGPIEITIVETPNPTTVPVDVYGEIIGNAYTTANVDGFDVWRGGELTPAPSIANIQRIPLPASAGEQMEIVSESGSNSAAGTGIRTLRIVYLDPAGNELFEDITLNGTTPVTSTATDIAFVQNLFALTVGTNGSATGHIKVRRVGTTNLVFNMIAAGDNSSGISQYKVPAGKTLVLKSWNASEAFSRRVTYRVRSTDESGILVPDVFISKGSVALDNITSGSLVLNARIPPLSVVKVTGFGDQIDWGGSVSWYGELIDNP